jgi:hypothetical protein
VTPLRTWNVQPQTCLSHGEPQPRHISIPSTMPSLIEDFDLQPKYSLSQSYSGSPRTPDPFHVDASMGSVKSNGPAHKTYRAPANKGVDTLESLRALPTLREIPWKEGRELAPEQISKQCTRVQTRGAFLLVQRGQVRIPSCNRCTAGTGRFSQCVSLDGWFKGACATCEMATRGNLCSLRKELEGMSRERCNRDLADEDHGSQRDRQSSDIYYAAVVR